MTIKMEIGNIVRILCLTAIFETTRAIIEEGIQKN